VDKPEELTFASVRESLMHIVPLCLDSDPSLIPRACKSATASSSIWSSPSGASQLVPDSPTPSSLDTGPSLSNKHPESGYESFANTDPSFDPPKLINANTNTDTYPSTNIYTDSGTVTSASPKTDTFSLNTDDGDPDDFTFWEAGQAKRICLAIEQLFGVEYAPEVVVADANLTALANRILLSKEILTG
jgi:phosphatidylethanolamine N-methyltransferase